MKSKEHTSKTLGGLDITLDDVGNAPLPHIIQEFEDVVAELKGIHDSAEEGELGTIELHKGQILLTLSKGVVL